MYPYILVLMPQQLQVARTAAVCATSDLQGAISVGDHCAVHPGACILAADGPVVLGERCFVEDGAVLASAGSDGLHVGSGNLFESGCDVRSTRVGDGNCFEPKAQAREGSVIGSNCLIGSGVVVTAGERVPDNSILVAVGARRVVRPQQEFLVKTHAALIQKYADIFPRGAKSPYALEKHHELRQ